MSLATLSLAALVVAMIVSCVSSVHVGFLSIVLAWLVGVYFGGMRVEQVIAGFPSGLFLTLVGITLLFAQAQANGTLERLAHRAVVLCRGVRGLIPLMFFGLTAALSSIGPGNIASTALMAPVGMAAAGRYGIPAFLMAIMIANGASAGSVSPIAPTGIVVNGIVAKLGLPNAQWSIYFNNFLAHTAVAVTGYFLLGGWRLFAKAEPARAVPGGATTARASETPLDVSAGETFEWRHWLTLGVIATLVVSVVAFGVNVGFGALAGAIVLTVTKATDDVKAIRDVPWKVIMLVCGVTVLVAILEKTGGMELFSAILARLSTPRSATAVTAFFTGLVSIYSSTTGVVLPAFLPTVPGLITRMGGGNPMALISAMTVGGHLVDVSPLSTLGALCLAAAPAGTDTRKLFNQLMAWGMSMTVVGAAVCWLLFS